jgi:hypothetical protein
VLLYTKIGRNLCQQLSRRNFGRPSVEITRSSDARLTDSSTTEIATFRCNIRHFTLAGETLVGKVNHEGVRFAAIHMGDNDVVSHPTGSHRFEEGDRIAKVVSTARLLYYSAHLIHRNLIDVLFVEKVDTNRLRFTGGPTVEVCLPRDLPLLAEIYF